MTKKLDRPNFIALLKIRFKLKSGKIITAWWAKRIHERLMSEEEREQIRKTIKFQTHLDDKHGIEDVVACVSVMQVTTPGFIYTNPSAMLALRYIEDRTMGKITWRDLEEEEKETVKMMKDVK